MNWWTAAKLIARGIYIYIYTHTHKQTQRVCTSIYNLERKKKKEISSVQMSPSQLMQLTPPFYLSIYNIIKGHLLRGTDFNSPIM